MKIFNKVTKIVVFLSFCTSGIYAQTTQDELLMTALKAKDLKNALVLVQNIYNANYCDDNKKSLLMYASGYGFPEVCKILIEKGAILDSQDTQGFTALIMASLNGHTEVVKLLLDKDADYDFHKSDSGTTIIITDEKLGYIGQAEQLIDALTDKLHLGETALAAASSGGYTDIVKLLLDREADINLTSASGMTPLMLASKNGRTEIVKLLLDKGANYTVSGPYEITALMLASLKGHSDVVKLLLDEGVQLDLQTKNGFTALILASYNGQTDVVKLLIERGANPKLKLKGKTAYFYAGNSEIKNLLSTYMKK